MTTLTSHLIGFGTRLERYAICPHEYFVRRMPNVEPVETHKEVVEISVMDVGSLVHECLDKLISECAESGATAGFRPIVDRRAGQRLRAIASVNADAFEAEGRKGQPLM